MKYKLWLRRMSVSAPQLRVTNHIAWPIRWALFVLGAVAFLFVGALIYDSVTGISRSEEAHLQRANAELAAVVQQLRAENHYLQSSNTLLKAQSDLEKESSEKLRSYTKDLEMEVAQSEEDVAFIQSQLPSQGGLVVNRLTGKVQGNTLLYRILLFYEPKSQGSKRMGPAFDGTVAFEVVGQQGGNRVSLTFPDNGAEPLAIHISSTKKLTGSLALPEGFQAKYLVVKILAQNGAVVQKSFQF